MLVRGVLLIVLALIGTEQAWAHASEQGFVLLLPTKAYISAGVAAVALTVLMLAFVPAGKSTSVFRNFCVSKAWFSGKLPQVTSLISFAFLIGLLYFGIAGSRDPLSNPLPLFIWTVWWIGFLTLQGLFGNLWHWVNPWVGIYSLIRPDGNPLLGKLPRVVGLWPGVMGLLLVSSFALADLAPDDPDRLAFFIIGYYVYTLVGMLLFGGEPWLSRGECFTILLRFYALMAPFNVHGNPTRAEVQFGFPGWRAYRWSLGMIHTAVHRFGASSAIFVLVMLACGSFDGINETFWWLSQIGINPLEFPGRSAIVTETVLGFLAANVLLILVFTFCVALGVWSARSVNPHSRVTFYQAFCVLAIGVLPIAFAYHVAHFLTTFLVNIQYSVAAASDPMHNGADILGLGTFYVTTGFFNTHHTVHWIWLTQAGTVVAGHLISVLLTHALAVNLWSTVPMAKRKKAKKSSIEAIVDERPIRLIARSAVVSQVPLAVFMIFYTFLGLWLLASPRGV